MTKDAPAVQAAPRGRFPIEPPFDTPPASNARGARRSNPRIDQNIEASATKTLMMDPTQSVIGSTCNCRKGAFTAADHHDRSPLSINHA
jgi:hypothetical protein